MKKLFTLSTLLFLASCASIMTKHRMKAADRKLSDCQSMQSDGKWEEARIMSEKLRSSVAKSVTDKPVRTSTSGAEVDLRPLFTAWEKGPWQDLRKALETKNAAASEKAFTSLRQQCTSCHLVLGRNDIQITPWPKP